MITEQIIVTVITAQIALIEQKIDQLSTRVEKHNSVIERMYRLEGEVEVIKKEVEN